MLIPTTLLVLAALAANARAGRGEDAEPESDGDQPLEELFLGEAIYPQERGELQVSTGVRAERAGDDRSWSSSALFEYGLTDRLQFELDAPYAIHDEAGEHGFGNLGLGTLYQLGGTADERLRFACGAEIEFTRASSPVEEEASAYELFALGYREGERWDVNAGLGLELTHDDGDDDLGVNGAVAWITDLGRAAGTLELAAEVDDDDFELSGAPGLTTRLGEFELGFAVAVGLSDDAPDWQVFLTLTREFFVGPGDGERDGS